ncbi:LysR family transcriptional regulator [Pseudomonas sp. PA-3-11C]|uniref:LysR family transcriptional regulator n=1 Tax=unclassified Pseudomonas TaxID=196821 RepID=UPI001F457D50|nr:MULTISPECIES: LysR family transcriptional regulator [unclassified Pseudomonas]MCF5510789.1 LysR family transcriptional regulator [Pseudomonas sp. PA-3-6H]MCF5517639.1 LysR family transcriptional regulator [Pseudomonas sp. PA-3-6E]MCF5564890.1 LysR family transcriptional regulator [Pseudomonas sp. PA-3-5D]MCF5569608.1 LysR family transcriptional regulator [Pseudomonas sp. PA-3-11C]MCF5596265.1 LysR family transcriptional regulator [Pseudomonas sp. PA-3-10C]
MDWTFDQLRQFVITAECGSFTAAARTLGKAQSAVSTAVSLLEIDLGVELFDRSGRKARLSEKGQILLEEAREVMRQAEQFHRRAQGLSHDDDAKITLAMDEALPYSVTNMLLKEFSTRYEHVELVLLSGSATEVVSFLDQGKADLAFHFELGSIPRSFDERLLGTVPQGIFVSVDHPLTECNPAQISNLVRYRQLLRQAGSVESVVISPKIWRSDSFRNIAEMVSADLGWAILPVNIAKLDNYDKPLTQVKCNSLFLPQLSVKVSRFQGRIFKSIEMWLEKRFGELLLEVGAK